LIWVSILSRSMEAMMHSLRIILPVVTKGRRARRTVDGDKDIYCHSS